MLSPMYTLSRQNEARLNEIQAWIDRRLGEAEPRLAWKPRDEEGTREWQALTRQAILSAAGAEFEKPALDLELGAAAPADGYTRTAVSFATLPGLRGTGYFLDPAGPPPGPAVLCFPGHGAGVRAIVGLVDEPYQADFAIQCVRQGYRVLAVEPLGFGTRVSERNPDRGSSCEADGRAALALGESLPGWRLAEAFRALDVLAELPGVDEARIATMGISGGALLSLWTAALDERVRAAVVSGYFCTFRESILSVDHCLDNFVPGVSRLLEMPDFAGLIAPRALFVESGTKDDLFPLAGFRRAVHQATQIFHEMGCSTRFGAEEFEGGHQFWGKAAFEFLKGVL